MDHQQPERPLRCPLAHANLIISLAFLIHSTRYGLHAPAKVRGAPIRSFFLPNVAALVLSRLARKSSTMDRIAVETVRVVSDVGA